MYFEKPGESNTQQTLDLAYERGRELGVNEVVVASSSGETGFLALKTFPNFKVTVVTYHCGFKEPFQNVMPDDAKSKLRAQGAEVIAATHALSGVERSLFNKYKGALPVVIIADTLRLFGQGVKVAVEVAIMAADAGALSGADIISIGGTAHGADAALVLKPANQSSLFDMRIREVICKPRVF